MRNIGTSPAMRAKLFISVWLICLMAWASAHSRNESSTDIRKPLTHSNARLLKIQKNDFVAHVLPESHKGTMTEDDDYFREIIIYHAADSKTIINESAHLNLSASSPLNGQFCIKNGDALALAGKELVRAISRHHKLSYWTELRDALSIAHGAEAEERFEIFLRDHPMTLNYWDYYFFILGRIEEEVISKLLVTENNNPKVQRDRLSPFERILKALPQPAIESIESQEDFAAALCDLDSKNQHLIFREALDAADGLSKTPQTTDDAERVVAFYLQLMRTQLTGNPDQESKALEAVARLTPSLRLVHDDSTYITRATSIGPATDKMILGARNAIWAQRIDDHARAGRQGLFYVLGAAHFVDHEHFDGLVTHLKRRGFRVDLVE